MSKKYVEIIGPCSKYIDGKGWVTQVPEELLISKGYVNVLETMQNIYNTEQYKQTVSQLNAQVQTKFECKYIRCDSDGCYCKLNEGKGYNHCVLPFYGTVCPPYEKIIK